MSMSDSDDIDLLDGDSDNDLDENLNYRYANPWKSETEETTNKEIRDAYIEPGRSLICLEFGKVRRTFGKKIVLNDRDATETLHYIGQHYDPQYSYHVKKRTNDVGLQASGQKVCTSTQTNWNKKINKAVETTDQKNYQDLDDEVANSDLVAMLQKAYILMEEALTANETINIFSDDFNLTADDDGFRQGGATELSIIKEIKSFEFEECKNKLISCIQFQPKGVGQQTSHNIVATSFMEDLTFDERIEVCGRSYKNEILFWDYEDMHLFVPVLVLISPLEITTFQFKPNDPNILIAGAINGQVLLWNLSGKLVKKDTTTTKKTQRKTKDDKTETQAIPPVIMSVLQEPFNIAPVVPQEIYSRKLVNSHKNHITALKFLPSRVELDKKNPLLLVPKNENCSDFHNFLTASSDGQILFWDTRFESKDKKTGQISNQPDYNVLWKAIQSVQLYRPEGGTMGNANVSFNPQNHDKTQFFGSSDEGDLYFGDWCAKPTDEQNKIEVMQRVWSSERSGRPTVALDISSFFDDIILTVYDCYFTIWKYDCEDPIFISPTIKNTFITSGFFSPSRPGVIFIGRSDGFLDIWDFIDQSNAPTQQHLVVACGIHSMKINPLKPHLLAAGDRDGCLHMLELPKNQTRKVISEETVISDFFGREMARVDYFKERMEIRQEQHRKKVEEQEQADGGRDYGGAMIRKDDDKAKTEDEQLEEAYQEFLSEFFNEGKTDEKKDEKDTKKKR